jgi:hypothetical protein
LPFAPDCETLRRKHQGVIVGKFRLATLLGVCLAFVSATLWAQQDGTINGKISDSSGAVLPGVGITIASPQLLGFANGKW